MCILVSR